MSERPRHRPDRLADPNRTPGGVFDVPSQTGKPSPCDSTDEALCSNTRHARDQRRDRRETPS